MDKDESFDLSNFITDSLCLQENVTSPLRAMHASKINDRFEKLKYENPIHILGEDCNWEVQESSNNVKGTPIQQYFRDANILITGGTGFIGKILIEKMIRSLPNLKHIYLLIRPKRGTTSEFRFQQLIGDRVFLRMKTEVPHFLEKITCIEGDLTADDLGLSKADHQMLTENVNVVFHSAADVRFLEPLRVAVQSNVLGSRRVLYLAKQMKHLKAYVHVSTAFSQCVRRVVEENVPQMNINYREILAYIKSKTDEEIEVEQARILQGWPNTYTFSKALTEMMIKEEADDLPICIFRPSVVFPTYKEPVRGWTDNLYGPVGMLVACGMGLLHHFRVNCDQSTDSVPVDYVVNAMIAAAFQTATTSRRIEDNIRVFNFTSGPSNVLSWKTIFDFGDKCVNHWPFSQAIWYVSTVHTNSYLLDEIVHIVLHKIPGKCLDAIAVMNGQKPRLSKVYDRIYVLKDQLHYFLNQSWEFKNDNVADLWKLLTTEDKSIFYFDVCEIDFMELLFLGKLGVRYFYLKESMDTIPAALKKLRWLKWAHYTFVAASTVVAIKVLACMARALPI